MNEMIADCNYLFNPLLPVFKDILHLLSFFCKKTLFQYFNHRSKKVLTLIKIQRRIITVNQTKEITSCCRLIILNSTSSPKRLFLANTLNLFLRTKTHITISIQSFAAI